MIPKVNMFNEHLDNLARIFLQLKNCLFVELLPYHPFGSSKEEKLGLIPTIYEKPTKDDILSFANRLKDNGVKVKCYGEMI